jgi:hypothetical protein
MCNLEGVTVRFVGAEEEGRHFSVADLESVVS